MFNKTVSKKSYCTYVVIYIKRHVAPYSLREQYAYGSVTVHKFVHNYIRKNYRLAPPFLNYIFISNSGVSVGVGDNIVIALMCECRVSTKLKCKIPKIRTFLQGRRQSTHCEYTQSAADADVKHKDLFLT